MYCIIQGSTVSGQIYAVTQLLKYYIMSNTCYLLYLQFGSDTPGGHQAKKKGRKKERK